MENFELVAGTAIVYAMLFFFTDYLLENFIEEAVFKKTRIHGVTPFYRKAYIKLQRFLIKQDFIPKYGNRFLFIFIPVIVFSLSLGLWSTAIIIPEYKIVGINLFLQYGIMLLISILIFICAWASNNKYSILSSYKLSDLIIPLEMSLLLLYIAMAITFKSTNIGEIILQQNIHPMSWGIVRQPIGALMYLLILNVKTFNRPYNYLLEQSSYSSGILSEYSTFGKSLLVGGLKIQNIFMNFFFVLIFLGADSIPFSLDLLDQIRANSYVATPVVILIKYIFVLSITNLIKISFPAMSHKRITTRIRKYIIPVLVFNLLITVLIMRNLK